MAKFGNPLPQKEWSKITTGKFVLQTTQGYKLQLKAKPPYLETRLASLKQKCLKVKEIVRFWQKI